jgi:hypothetical protein
VACSCMTSLPASVAVHLRKAGAALINVIEAAMSTKRFMKQRARRCDTDRNHPHD